MAYLIYCESTNQDDAGYVPAVGTVGSGWKSDARRFDTEAEARAFIASKGWVDGTDSWVSGDHAYVEVEEG